MAKQKMPPVVVEVTNINFAELKAQKAQLLELQSNPAITEKQADAINGILNLIDAIQDQE